jgi:hypothetical protein
MVQWISAKTMTDEFAAGVVLCTALGVVHQAARFPFTLGFRRDDQDVDVGRGECSEVVHIEMDRNELRGLVGKRRDECFSALLNRKPAAGQV